VPDAQDNLFRSPQIRSLGSLQEGTTDAELFADGLGGKFVGKFDDGTRPFILPNEVIGSRLALLTRLRAPEYAGTVVFQGVEYVLLRYIANSKKFADAVRWRSLTSSFKDLEIFRQVYSFDFWIGNRDRNYGNLMITPRESQDLELWVIDHERTLFQEGPDTDGLAEVQSELCSKIAHIDSAKIIEQCYQTRRDFDRSIGVIASITNLQIEDAVCRDTDALFVGKDFRGELVKSLIERRDRLGFYIDCLFHCGTLTEKP
jgi:hypothetical protein